MYIKIQVVIRFWIGDGRDSINIEKITYVGKLIFELLVLCSNYLSLTDARAGYEVLQSSDSDLNCIAVPLFQHSE